MNLKDVLRLKINDNIIDHHLDLNRIKNLYPGTSKRREIERSLKKSDNIITRPPRDIDNVKHCLQKKLIIRGKVPNISFNNLIKTNLVNNPRF